ncbi:MAG: hypothetical protein ACK481_00750 [Candidatus Melainabacteria bacterium]|jgi:hypothetical protein
MKGIIKELTPAKLFGGLAKDILIKIIGRDGLGSDNNFYKSIQDKKSKPKEIFKAYQELKIDKEKKADLDFTLALINDFNDDSEEINSELKKQLVDLGIPQSDKYTNLDMAGLIYLKDKKKFR